MSVKSAGKLVVRTMKRLSTVIIFVFAAVSTPLLSIGAQDLALPGEPYLVNLKHGTRTRDL
jgi:hypothetical protein